MSAAAKRIEKSADAYRSIGEAADELGLQPHVLRYWEGKFTKYLKPMKRPDGRRMFRPEDMEALRAIQLLVHERGMTLKGAQQLINEQGIEKVLAGQAILSANNSEAPSTSPARELQETIRSAFGASEGGLSKDGDSRGRLESMLADLVDIKARLDKARLSKAA
ncbi:MerR family transcriptional regulator [Henriciella sp.]|uniref:MerR family transcriptional regulator n=1 Tax=Henriciella sp. TaxID=1968823 RepID=UPI00262D0189|nr:MerR family transcriptional regulator [Henriciella sp.]